MKKKIAIIIPPKRELVMPELGPATLSGLLKISGVSCVLVNGDHVMCDYYAGNAAFINKFFPDIMDSSEMFNILVSVIFFKKDAPGFSSALAREYNITGEDTESYEEFLNHWMTTLKTAGVTTIGLSLHWMNFISGCLMAEYAKMNSMDVIFGGPQLGYGESVSWLRMYCSDLADCCIRGKGEAALLGYFGKKMNDEMVIPDFSGIDMSRYIFKNKYPVLINDGCSYSRCTFCNYHATGINFKLRHDDHILKNIECYMENSDPESVYFVTSNFHNGQFTLNLLKKLIRSGLNIKWDTQMRMDGVNEEFIGYAAESGCTRLYFGLEAVNNNLLRKMNKGYTAEEALALLEILHRASSGLRNFTYAFNLIFGFPGETYEDLVHTLSVFRDRRSLFTGHINELRKFDLVFHSDVYDNPGRYGISITGGLQDYLTPAGKKMHSFTYSWRYREDLPRNGDIDAVYDDIRNEIRSFNSYYNVQGD